MDDCPWVIEIKGSIELVKEASEPLVESSEAVIGYRRSWWRRRRRRVAVAVLWLEMLVSTMRSMLNSIDRYIALELRYHLWLYLWRCESLTTLWPSSQ